MADKYKNFRELKEAEESMNCFDIESEVRDGSVAIIAIHGGRIEPGTTEIARFMAGSTHSFYSFVGKSDVDNGRLHITSAHFDEPTCCEIVSRSENVISVHGKSGEDLFVMVGGLDENKIKETEQALARAGFKVVPPEENVNGNSPQNICNKGVTKKGLQLEISRGLRELLIKDEELLAKFATAVIS